MLPVLKSASPSELFRERLARTRSVSRVTRELDPVSRWMSLLLTSLREDCGGGVKRRGGVKERGGRRERSQEEGWMWSTHEAVELSIAHNTTTYNSMHTYANV